MLHPSTSRTVNSEILRVAQEILQSTHSAKAYAFAVSALLLAAIRNFSPVGVGVWLALHGQWLPALIVTILLYGMYVLWAAYWPVWVTIAFVGNWIEQGFLNRYL